MRKEYPDYERVRELFNYHEDGKLIWEKSLNNYKPKGAIAGNSRPDNYWGIQIDKKFYFVHRIIWIWHHGYNPENELDHIDRNPSNNRIENLREVSHSCNIQNYENRKDNKSGVRGVHWFKPTKKWQARIVVSNTRYSLGHYKDFNEAVLARLAGEQCLDWSTCDSSSSAYKYAINNNLIRRKYAN